MHSFADKNNQKIVELLQSGAIGIIRTDTLYGIVASATNEEAVQRIYELKGRDDDKSPIVLISHASQLFDNPSDAEKKTLEEHWPGKVSIILASKSAPIWIRRGNDSVAYRLPADEGLTRLLEQTGPLIAPSANPQGLPPAMSVSEAAEYFGESVDFYVDEGPVEDNHPSKLLRVNRDGTTERLR